MDRRSALINSGKLAGATILLPSLLSLLQSCKSETRLSWKPTFLQVDEAKCISEIVDLIIPRTDTPGALDVKVDIFLDKLFDQTYTPEAQRSVREEINAFNERTKSQFGATFIRLPVEDKIAFLHSEEKSSGKFNPSVWGTAVGDTEPIGFYRSLKSMAIWAYTSSEEIGKNVLSYDPIPTEFSGCIPVSEVGNRWSL